MTEQTTPNRIFKIGTNTIVEDDSMRDKPLEDIKNLLKRTYPEVAHATARESTLEDGTHLVEWIPKAGSKG